MEHPLSIAVVTETYPPEINGVSLSLERAVAHLRGRGHRVDLVRPRQAGEDGSGTDLLVRGLPLPRYPGLQFGLPAGWSLARRWRAVRPDVVHIVTEGPLGWAALAVARHLGIAVTTDYRTHFQKYSAHYRLGFLAGPIAAALRAFHNRSDLTFVATSALAHELARAGYRNLAQVGRGVDGELFSPRRRSSALRHRWGAGEDHLVVMHVGRLAPEKDPYLVRAAFQAIRQARPEARLVWVGDGPWAAAMEREGRGKGEVFAGLRRGEDLAAHYASADLFLFPSLSETFGNVVLEAMASALPIVAYDIGAARQHLADGISARVLRPAQGPAGFVAAARALATQGVARRALATVARETARELAWPVVLGRFEAHLAACAVQPGTAGDVAPAA